MPDPGSEPPTESPSDRLTIVVHLPQPFDRVVALMAKLGELWPTAPVVGNVVEIPSDG
jgi:hypothetical protein